MLSTKSLPSDTPQKTGSLCPCSDHGLYFHIVDLETTLGKRVVSTAIFQALSQTGSALNSANLLPVTRWRSCVINDEARAGLYSNTSCQKLINEVFEGLWAFHSQPRADCSMQ